MKEVRAEFIVFPFHRQAGTRSYTHVAEMVTCQWFEVGSSGIIEKEVDPPP
jgi:hypothetical protein